MSADLRKTWADDFGVWHARVPATPHRHEMTAYQWIREELVARQGAEVPAFGLAVVSEDAEFIVYREDWPEPECNCTNPHCQV